MRNTRSYLRLLLITLVIGGATPAYADYIFPVSPMLQRKGDGIATVGYGFPSFLTTNAAYSPCEHLMVEFNTNFDPGRFVVSHLNHIEIYNHASFLLEAAVGGYGVLGPKEHLLLDGQVFFGIGQNDWNRHGSPQGYDDHLYGTYYRTGTQLELGIVNLKKNHKLGIGIRFGYSFGPVDGCTNLRGYAEHYTKFLHDIDVRCYVNYRFGWKHFKFGVIVAPTIYESYGNIISLVVPRIHLSANYEFQAMKKKEDLSLTPASFYEF